MSIPKKGSRKIVVHGKEYLWLIRSKPTYSQECEGGSLTCAVELIQNEKSTLNIVFPFQRPDSLMSNEVFSITPNVIKACILKAIDQGWQPSFKGGTFRLYYES
jgi:hypothetical protein